MKEILVFQAVFVILFSKDSSACFIENSINNKSVMTGSTFYEECCCTEPGYTIKDLHWLDPHNRVILGPGTDFNVYIEKQGDCLSLYIPYSSKSLTGAYRCVTTVNGVPHSQTHNVDVFDPLNFYESPKKQFLTYGENSLISCKAMGASTPYIRWYRGEDGQNEIYNDTVKYQFIPENGLFVKNVSNDDSGTYKCSASVLTTGEEIELNIEVKIRTAPTITDLQASPEAVMVAGEALMIQCTAQGLPEPTFEWTFMPKSNPGELRNVSRMLQINNTIRFEMLNTEDAGIYECIARNLVGVSRKQINISVFTPPEIIGFNNRSVLEGTEIILFCNAKGIPSPDIIITYEGRSFEEDWESEYEIFIPNFTPLKVNRSSEGIYICNASNEVDTKSELMYLTILHQPYFDETFVPLWGWSGETVNISCAHESNPPSNFTWSYIKSNYSTVEKLDDIVLNYESTLEHSLPFTDQFAPFGFHECKVQNEYGEATKIYHIKTGYSPSEVENATTIDETATSATFAIQTPTFYDGPQVIGYIAEYDEAENYVITNIHPNRTWATGITYKLEKLRPNTTYYIRFAAINQVGPGPWSEPLVFYTMEKSAPEPPIWLLNPVVLSSNKVLQWKAPENNGEPIDYYALRYCPIYDELDESLCKEHRVEEKTELVASDLQFNTTYYLELIAHNAEGNSTPANISLTIPGEFANVPESLLSGGALIGISVIVVIICLILLDLLLFFWRKQGIVASCCQKKSKKRKPNPLNSRDKKGLLKDNGESGTDDTLKRPNNGHKEYEYNKTTGIITGKHSSV